MEKNSAESGGDSAPAAGKEKKKCPYCPFASYYSASVTVHVRRHTGEKPYQCPYCPKVKRFCDRSNMNSHIRRYHKRPAVFHMRHHGQSSQSSSTIKSKPIASKINHRPSPHFNYYPLEQMPIISSVYSTNNEQSKSGLNDGFLPVEVVEKIESPISISPDNSPTSILPEMPLHQTLLKKNRRRKQPFVKKKNVERSERNDETIISRLKQMLAQNNCQQTSEDGSDTIVENTSNPSMGEDYVDDISRQSSEDNNTANVQTVPAPMPSNKDMASSESIQPDSTKDLYCCKHCDIYFKNCVLHTLHMGLHGYDDPFKCNTCGVKCNNAIEFHCHFARGNHNGTL